jgi:hypothetical protein
MSLEEAFEAVKKWDKKGFGLSDPFSGRGCRLNIVLGEVVEGAAGSEGKLGIDFEPSLYKRRNMERRL